MHQTDLPQHKLANQSLLLSFVVTALPGLVDAQQTSNDAVNQEEQTDKSNIKFDLGVQRNES